MRAFSGALRERVRDVFPLADNEIVEFEVVTDKPWSGFNYYKGDYQSTVAVNADLKQQMSNLRVYAGEQHPHEAQQPEVLDVKALNPKNTRSA